MNAEENSENDAILPIGFSSLPVEIIEYILDLLSPYRDLESAMCVCKLWNELGRVVITKKMLVFKRLLQDGRLATVHIDSQLTVNSKSMIRMTERFSHCSAYHDKSIYVFGGSTKGGNSNTTFNDIWRFDLTERMWHRPMVTGRFPSPKAAATLVTYRNRLVLFGGFCDPTPTPFFQAEQLFSELHVYDINTCLWTRVETAFHPPGTAGHSASVICDRMVVMGGSRGLIDCTNEVWQLNLVDYTWERPYIRDLAPCPRFGQEQVTIDNVHIAIVGGRSGPTMALVLVDLWLLNTKTWTWVEIKVNALHNAPPHLWCRGSALVDDKLVVVTKYQKRSDETQYDRRDEPCSNTGRELSRTNFAGATSSPSTNEQAQTFSAAPRANDNAQNYVTRRENEARPHDASISDRVGDVAPQQPSRPSIRRNAMSNRKRQLEMLQKYEQLIAARSVQNRRTRGEKISYPNPFHIHVLDLSKIITAKESAWLPVMQCPCATACRPKEIFFYSLIGGRAELILIGGLRTPFPSMGGVTKNTPAESSRDVFVFTAPNLGVL